MGGVLQSYGSVSDLTNGITSPVNLSSSASSVPYGPVSTNPASQNGEGPNYQAYHVGDMDIEQWSLAVQRMLRTNIVAEVAYVGSHGYHLPFAVDINQVPESKLGPNDNPSGRPYPQFQNMYTQSGTNNAVTNYNALQVSITQRMSSGLTFSFNYVWSHMLSMLDSSGWYGGNQGTEAYQNAFDRGANYGASNFDVRNAFKGYVTYQLPFGIGRRFLNGGGVNGRILDAVIGGWNTAGIILCSVREPLYAGGDSE